MKQISPKFFHSCLSNFTAIDLSLNHNLVLIISKSVKFWIPQCIYTNNNNLTYRKQKSCEGNDIRSISVIALDSKNNQVFPVVPVYHFVKIISFTLAFLLKNETIYRYYFSNKFLRGIYETYLRFK